MRDPGEVCRRLTPAERATVQDPDVVRAIVSMMKTIAVVGLSHDPRKPSHGVARYLMDRGYRIIPVTPRTGPVMGLTPYPDLKSVPEVVDVVNVFRPSSEVAALAESAAAIGAKALWTQYGIIDAAAGARARAAGLAVVMDACLKIEHARYAGSSGSASR
jgi:predicted CoA-binding protein